MLEQENERLNFVKEMAEADQGQTFLDILQAKTAIMKNVKRKIERFQTREQIIIKVLDIINQKENQEMFKQDDKEILAEYEAVRKEWE